MIDATFGPARTNGTDRCTDCQAGPGYPCADDCARRQRPPDVPCTVLCARCEHPWSENDEGVRYAYGDWWCTDETECDDRRFEDAQAGDHPDGF